jgi:hypothetical protein
VLQRTVVMVTGAALLAASASAAPGSPGRPGPPGRVERVDRAGRAPVAPRLCEIRGDAGTCVGDEPKPGQPMVVLGEHGLLAEAQVTEATSVVTTCTNLWSVKLRILHGDAPDSDGIGVIDSSLDPHHARVLDKAHMPASPSGLSGDEVWRAIDRDGDGTADILFTHYSCDAAGALITGGSEYCLDIWARVHTRMIRTTQLNFAQCNL